MRKLLYCICTLLLLQSCSHIVPLKGKYQDTPVKTTFNKPLESVWESIIDYIADTGQEVQLIDHSSGLIISDVHVASGSSLSNEDKKGVLINPGAYIVSERYSHEYPYGALPTHRAIAKYTIRAKELKSKDIEVSVLLHVKAVEKRYGRDNVFTYAGVSTGLLEKQLINDLYKRLDR